MYEGMGGRRRKMKVEEKGSDRGKKRKKMKGQERGKGRKEKEKKMKGNVGEIKKKKEV